MTGSSEFFLNEWVSLIMCCVSWVSFSFKLNGGRVSCLQPSRSLRDPLSPYLFLLCAQRSLSLLSGAEVWKQISRFKLSRFCPSISHLFFPHNSLLFFKASFSEGQVVLQLFDLYEQASGQTINFDKSVISFSQPTPSCLQLRISSLLRVKREDYHALYLGLPTFIPRNRRGHFRFVND